MKSSILKLIGVLFIAGILGISFTNAFFSDRELSTQNIITVFAPSPSPTVEPSPSPTPPPISQVLVVNEVLFDSTCDLGGNKKAHWIEVWNGFSTQINLKDYKINDGTDTIGIVNSNLLLNPGQFALLAKDNSVWTQCGFNPPSESLVPRGNLGPQIDLDTGTLKLLDPPDVVIDKVLFNGIFDGQNLDPPSNQSIERKSTGLDSASGDNFVGTDFEIRNPPKPGTQGP